MNKPSIFISYAREDEDIAIEIYSYLQENGFEIWMDKFSLIPGQDWKLEIQKAIESSDIFIACLSNNSVSKKGYVQKELKKALDVLDEFPEGRIFLIPVRLDDCTVPTTLWSKHWLDWFKPKSKDDLKKAIELSALSKKTNRSLFEEIIDRETENWLSTGTYISSQRLLLILEKREQIPPLGLKQAECVIMSLWDSHFHFTGWETITKNIPEEKILEILIKWRASKLSNQYSPDDLRLFLLRLLGNYRSDADIYLLGSINEKERIKGIEHLQKYAVDRNILPLLYCLYDDNSNVVAAANLALQRYDDFAIAPVISFARDEKSHRLIGYLIEVVGAIGKNSVDKLMPFLHDKDATIRWFTAQTLGEIKNVRSAPEILKLLDDSDTRVAISAIEALGKIKSKVVISELLDFFATSDEPEILQSLALTFSQYNDEVFIEPLKKMSNSTNLAVKNLAIDILTNSTNGKVSSIFQKLISESENIDLLIERVKGLEINYINDGGGFESPDIYGVMEAISKLCQIRSMKAIDPIKHDLQLLYDTFKYNIDIYDDALRRSCYEIQPYIPKILDELKKFKTREVELFVENFEREKMQAIKGY